MRPAIKTHALTKRFRKLHSYRDLLLYPWRRADHLAVDGVSLEIAQGELFGILGQNGAGKTTLIKMLCTALLPSSGSASVAGYDIVHEARRVRGAIGLVSGEERSFYWRLTGRENLAFFAALYHVPPSEVRRRIELLLQGVGLTNDADRPFRTYSTGMRQKLAIARGLLNEPQVLFMDEPTRSLDPISAQGVRRFVADYIIGELGSTVILATHSMAEAEELCDRVALIRTGRIVAHGSVDQLRQTLHYGVHRELRLRHMPPDLPDALRRIPGVLSLHVAREDGLHVLDLAMGAEGALLAAVLREAIESGAEVYDCVTRQVSLEEIYLHTLGDAPVPAPPEAMVC
ncbi:MAG TPA: ABC transporter ATP-binding protein [Roseiflexaceae bacterium]